MPDDQKPLLVRDLFRFSDSVSSHRLQAARARYQYLLERKDRTSDHIRTGLILLNAASLLGVLTALGTDVVAQDRFGIRVSDMAYSACCFMLGMIAAGLSVMIDSWRLPGEAATQFDRVSREENYRGVLDSESSEKNVALLGERMEEVHALPPADFGFSHAANITLNLAGGAWLAGILLPLWRVGSLIAWFG